MTPAAVPFRVVTTPLRAPELIAAHAVGAPDAAIRLGDGWGLPEGNLRWTLGETSEITLPPPVCAMPHPDGRVLVAIRLSPYLGGNPCARQRIAAFIDGQKVRQISLERPGVFAFFIPADALTWPLTIRFQHPDALSPAALGLFEDRRYLAFAFGRMRLWSIPGHAAREVAKPAPGVATPGEILDGFESLGDNCEFGIAQRLCGIEPLALLRFTATALPALIDGLLHEFEGLGDPAAIDLDLRGDKREYILTQQRYNLTYHTFIYEDQMKPDRVRHRESQKLKLLCRRMLDDLRTGRRIYVIKQNDGLADDDVIMLHLLLNEFGPNRLLHVAQADAAHPAGTVALMLPGLARGYIERFAPYDNAAQISLESWVELCRVARHCLETP